jgi:outer membrane protein assembly factor BamB
MRNHGLTLVAGLTLLLLSCGGSNPPTCSLNGGQPLADTPWPKFRADVANTGQSDVDLSSFTVNGELELAWTFTTGGSVSSSPAVGPLGEIYIGSADSKAYRLDETTGMDGKPKAVATWQATTNNSITSGPALDAGGNVYFTSNDGNLYSYASATGGLNRPAFTVLGVLSSPAVAPAPNAGVVYVGSLNTGLFAVCPNNIARFASQVASVAAPAAVDAPGNVYAVGAGDGRFVSSLNPTNGVQNWIFTATTGINAAPMLNPGGTLLYVVDGLGRLFAVNTATGTAVDPATNQPAGAIFDLQQYDDTAQVFASPALGTNGTVYIADTNGGLWAVDPTAASDPVQGKLRWQTAVPAGVYSSPVVTADFTLIFGADDGVVYALADLGDTAAVRWTFATGGSVRSSPALAQNVFGTTIYVGSSDRRVYALRPPQ